MKSSHLSRLNETKLCDKKVSTAQYDGLACVESTYSFRVAVTKIAKFVMIDHLLCAALSRGAMVAQNNCAIVGDRVYSVRWVTRHAKQT